MPKAFNDNYDWTTRELFYSLNPHVPHLALVYSQRSHSAQCICQVEFPL